MQWNISFNLRFRATFLSYPALWTASRRGFKIDVVRVMEILWEEEQVKSGNQRDNISTYLFFILSYGLQHSSETEGTLYARCVSLKQRLIPQTIQHL